MAYLIQLHTVVELSGHYNGSVLVTAIPTLRSDVVVVQYIFNEVMMVGG